MERTKNFLLKSQFIAFLLLTLGLVTQVAYAKSADIKPAGTVTFTTGDASIIRADKSVVKAAKNDAVNAGDAIETKNGRLQLSLIDGGKVSLQPNTVYKINKYEFSGKEDGSEYAFTELLKGGMRTISGLIGHKNRERYQLKTAVATIGIRGTEFTVNFNDNNLLMTTNLGSVDVCNAGGCLNAVTGQSIAVNGIGAAPKPSSKAAKAAAAAPASSKAMFAVTDVITDSGLPVAIAQAAAPVTTPTTTAGDTIVSLATMTTGLDNNGVYVGTSIMSGNNLVTYIDNTGSPIIIPATTEESGTDAGLKYGRASSGLYNGQSMLMTTWITGTAAPAAALTGLVGTYNVSSSTAPYMVNGGTVTAVGASNSVTGNLNVDFSLYSFTYTLNVPIAGATYTQNSSGTLTPGAASFRDIGSSAGVLSGGSIVEGSLFGASAGAIGLQYGFNVSGSGIPGGGGNVYGAAILK
jgi:FecR protein